MPISYMEPPAFSGDPVDRRVELSGESMVNQEPTGLGLVNSIVVEFGAGSDSLDGTVRLHPDGRIEMLAPVDPLNLQILMRVGRTGMGGVADVILWSEFSTDDITYVQSGITSAFSVGSSAQVIQLSIDGDFTTLPTGSFLRIKVARDEANADDGGLFTEVPTGTLSFLTTSPSARIQLRKRTIA